ncbi:MAG: hypothetical protein IPN69_12655 [Acidobacteria bacterium]|nr:hypothetical protein [Acidobacteriota bacterium]
MKAKFLIPLFLSLSCVLSATAQTEEGSPVVEIGLACNEELSAIYDGLALQLVNDASLTGVITLIGDTLEGRNLSYLKWLNDYPRIRKYSVADRIRVVRGPNQQNFRIRIQTTVDSERIIRAIPDFLEKPIDRPTLFDRGWADVHRDEYTRRTAVINNSFLDLGCDFSPNISDFATKIAISGDVVGYVLIYTAPKRGPERADQVAKHILRSIRESAKFSPSRLRSVYGGTRKEPEVELWLVPKALEKSFNNNRETFR